MNQQNLCLAYELEEKDRNSQSTIHSSSNENQLANVKKQYFIEPVQVRQDLFELFKQKEQLGQISAKLNQKAISWLITLCWSKNIDDECQWQSILLYYIVNRKKPIKKNKLQLTLLTCLILVQKFYSSKPMKLRDFISTENKQSEIREIIEMQAEILQMMDFNVIVPHGLYFNDNEDECCERLNSIHYVCQLLMLNDHRIFLDVQMRNNVVELFDTVRTNEQKNKFLKDEVKKLMQMKQAKIVTKKYSSKLDLEIFNTTFL